MKIDNLSFVKLNFYKNNTSNNIAFKGEDEFWEDNDYNSTRRYLRNHLYNSLCYIPEPANPTYAITLEDLHIPNFHEIGHHSCCGASLVKNTEHLNLLKQNGIKRIIDLAGFTKLEQACKENGIEYFKYYEDIIFLQHPMFFDNETLMETKKIELIKKSLMKMNFDVELQQYKKTIQKQRAEFMNKFCELIDTINQGHFYISCEQGEFRTPNTLAMNTFFNSQWQGKKFFPTNPVFNRAIKNMYNNLTDKDKQRLNFTPEQEKFVTDYFKTIN